MERGPGEVCPLVLRLPGRRPVHQPRAALACSHPGGHHMKVTCPGEGCPLQEYVLVWNKSLQMQRLPQPLSHSARGQNSLWAKSVFCLRSQQALVQVELAKVSSDMEVLDFQAHPGRSQFSAVVGLSLLLLPVGGPSLTKGHLHSFSPDPHHQVLLMLHTSLPSAMSQRQLSPFPASGDDMSLPG